MTNSAKRTPLEHYRGGSGEPLLLLHGATSSWRCWESMLPDLVGCYDVLAPNLPGHAGQPGLKPFTIERAADALEILMDEAGFATAHIAGNSLGGWLAMELARRGRARSVVLLSPAGGWTSDEVRVPALFRSMRRGTQLGGKVLPAAMRVQALRRILMRLVCEHGDRMTPEQAAAGIEDVLACTLFDEMPERLEAQSEPFGDLGIPILLAWGTSDRVLTIPRYSDPWRRLLPTATWRTYPGVGHVPMLDNPALVSRAIIDWSAPAAADCRAS
ncbi:alpha/beta fold hydrolase [Nocardia sp. NPDC057663]|uniref:alpha/beta fold hydrolase n=1 Tax=Nocardia sp. NPDC057663 TaxID=3346201 RepID=UPI00366E0E19